MWKATWAYQAMHLMLKRVFFSAFCSSNPAHRYYLATDPVTGELYVSDTNTRRIYRPKSLTGAKDLTKNADVVAGTGEQCLPFDEARCGDGGKAVEATLMSPKGEERGQSAKRKCSSDSSMQLHFMLSSALCSSVNPKCFHLWLVKPCKRKTVKKVKFLIFFLLWAFANYCRTLQIIFTRYENIISSKLKGCNP